MAPHPWRPNTQKRQRPDRPAEPAQPVYSPAAYIQAYEAQLDYTSAASSSRGAAYDSGAVDQQGGAGREGLIRWSGGEEGDEAIWADRYDIIHLLPSLPSLPSIPASSSRTREPSPASSSSSWDDLPSDEEELFAISGDEAVETYEREKKRKWLERLREERLRERQEQDVVVQREDEAKAQAKAIERDEVPEAIRTLMLHTAKSIYAAPNPKSLEMRILANHAADARFAFLRGRWTGEWEKVKRGVRIEKGLEKADGVGSASVAMLGAYGSDSEDDEDEEEGDGSGGGEGEVGMEPGSPPPPPPDQPPDEPAANLGIEGGAGGEPERVVDDSVGAAVVESEAELEEKRRLRRIKLEEWKRSKKG